MTMVHLAVPWLNFGSVLFQPQIEDGGSTAISRTQRVQLEQEDYAEMKRFEKR
jgi:hypothetical protein